MKQNITVEQLSELSKKGKKRYWNKFWPKSQGEKVEFMQNYHNGNYYYKNSKNPSIEFYSLITIGQMIEFLWEHQGIQGMSGDEYGYLVMPTRSDEVEKLCDELWKDVKELLEK